MLARVVTVLAGVVTLSMIPALGNHANAAVFGLKNCGSSPTGGIAACSSGFVLGGGSMAPTVLFSFGEGAGSLDAGQFVVTNAGVNVHVDALAINASSTLYAYELATTVTPLATGNGVAAAVTASQLVTLDPNTGAIASSIGAPLSGRDIRGAAFGPLGQLWAIDQSSKQLLRINPGTGAVDFAVTLTLGAVTYPVSTVSDIAFRADGSAILTDVGGFYLVDTTTGALTFLFTGTGIQQGSSYAGIAFSDGAADDLLFAYEVSGGEDIRDFDLGNGNLETQQIGNIIPVLGGIAFNAGRGDLAALVTFPTALPEPATLTLVAAGLLGAALARRRRPAQTTSGLR